MKAFITLVAAAAAAVAVATASASVSSPEGAAAPTCPKSVIPGGSLIPGAVGCWNAIAVNAVRSGVSFQTQGEIHLSYAQAAVYDAVTKIEGRYSPYHDFAVPAGVNLAGASTDAAVAAAAYTTLVASFPAQAGALTTMYDAYLAALPDAGKADGVSIGQAAAADVIVYRAGDRDESITFTPGPLSPGSWTFAPPPSAQSAQTPWVATMRPFMLESPSQFRADPPPALASDEWAEDFNEVKAYGSANSSVRTAEQTALARFENANIINQYNQAFQDAAIQHLMSPVEAARLLAMGNLVITDSAIACFDSKYHHLFWRPVMAIRNADIDDNAATVADPTWTPLLTTPNHPEYPAAHGCLTSAAAEVFSEALGTNQINVTIHGSADGTANNFTATETYERVSDLQRQIVDARVWAGLHYRSSGVAGVVIGRKVAHWTLRRFFLPAA